MLHRLRLRLLFIFSLFLGLNVPIFYDYFNCHNEPLHFTDSILSALGIVTPPMCPTGLDLLSNVFPNFLVVITLMALVFICEIPYRKGKKNRDIPKYTPSPVWVSGSGYITDNFSTYTVEIVSIQKLDLPMLYGKKSGKLILVLDEAH